MEVSQAVIRHFCERRFTSFVKPSAPARFCAMNFGSLLLFAHADTPFGLLYDISLLRSAVSSMRSSRSATSSSVRRFAIP